MLKHKNPNMGDGEVDLAAISGSKNPAPICPIFCGSVSENISKKAAHEPQHLRLPASPFCLLSNKNAQLAPARLLLTSVWQTVFSFWASSPARPTTKPSTSSNDQSEPKRCEESENRASGLSGHGFSVAFLRMLHQPLEVCAVEHPKKDFSRGKWCNSTSPLAKRSFMVFSKTVNSANCRKKKK